MKKPLKILAILVAVVILLGAASALFVVNFLPAIPVQQELRVEATSERIARGKYLAHNVAVCMDCHSSRDWALFSGPLKPGTLGMGGERFDETMNFPGAFIAPNITPHALKDWSDGELYRAIASGVSKDGHPLFPIMPYPAYRKMATEDIYSIMAYIRSLPAVENSTTPSKAAPPVNIIMHLMPRPAAPVTLPAPSDAVAYGGYLANAAGCTECHTKMVQGKPAGEPYAGGFEFAMPSGTVRSPNITPHATTGIGAWTKQMFVERFKAYDPATFTPPPVDASKGEMQTVMPWTMYSGMTKEDLGALYEYLKTLPAIENQVERWTAAKK
ncbi:cytochrome c [Prosthecobacter fusiformis]|uniref:Cytochrome c n=1 Tax=Prosthecobacter fusiformis TaxID=48464 RepID=A0A4R7RNL1_9BACT|nr:c-type cytochrome [Prosthecobacter fusiformis]TDU66186.1 cytochrome c [Prosthecobacter fusiformis]